MIRAAEISPDGLHRFRLTRTWDSTDPVLVCVMLNPSTADATTDDPTIAKCIGFAQRGGYGGIDVVNLFAYRATDPRDLLRATAAGVDTVGTDNDYWIRWSATRAMTCVVVAWGARAAHPVIAPRADRVLRDLRRLRTLRCLGVTKTGQPRHPLMLPYATEWLPYG